MRRHAVLSAALSSLILSACGSDPAPDPVEQIVLREPGSPAESRAIASEGGAVDLVTAGEAAFAMCTGCHTAKAGEPSAAGPNLHGLLGREAGALADFDYSEALATSGIIWDAASLDRYLADPEAAVSGTYMAAGAVPDEERRAAIIAYLETLSE